MAKPSPFQALVDRQLEEDAAPPSPLISSSPERLLSQSVAQSGDQSPDHQHRGKSSNPHYQRLTVYLRRSTILDLKRRTLETNGELSDIVQLAVEHWIERQSH
jgi:hypothetical protein